MHEFSPFYFMISINTHFGGSSRVVFDENLSFSPHKICLSLLKGDELFSPLWKIFSLLFVVIFYSFSSHSHIRKMKGFLSKHFRPHSSSSKDLSFSMFLWFFMFLSYFLFYFIFIAAFVVSSFFMIHLTASRKQHWMSIKKTERKAFHFLKLLSLQLSILYDFSVLLSPS